MTTEELNIAWTSEVSDKASEVDEQNNEDWYSLCVGWAIGKGLTIDKAHEFARQAKL